MSKTLLALVIMSPFICAIAAVTKCYTRTGSTGSELGTANVKCDKEKCYAYIIGNKQHAGCGECPAKRTRDCFTCKIDNCNEELVTAPKFHCYERTNSTSDSTDGIEKECDSAETKCHSFKLGTKEQASCGKCPEKLHVSCSECTGILCNKVQTVVPVPPVKRKCYKRSGSTSEVGSSGPCDSETETHCYSYSYASKQFAGCGKCPAGTDSTFKCTDCNENDCNKEIVKSVICYKLPEETDRSQIYNPSTNSNVLCRSQDKCHHYTNSDKKKVADCGPCPAGVSDCKDCTSDYCNGNSKLVATGSATIIGILMLAVMKLGF